jgi:hypothetical protein
MIRRMSASSRTTHSCIRERKKPTQVRSKRFNTIDRTVPQNHWSWRVGIHKSCFKNNTPCQQRSVHDPKTRFSNKPRTTATAITKRQTPARILFLLLFFEDWFRQPDMKQKNKEKQKMMTTIRIIRTQLFDDNESI